MKRDYKDGIAEAVTYFTGVEIEKTPASYKHYCIKPTHLSECRQLQATQ
jgi:hypothetical protein